MESLSKLLSVPTQDLQALLNSKEHPVILDHIEIHNNVDIQDLLFRRRLYDLAASLGFTVKVIIADQYAELEGQFDGDYLKIPVATAVVSRLFANSPAKLLFTGEYRSPQYWAMTLDFATRNSLNAIKEVAKCVNSDAEKMNSSHIYAISMACIEPMYHNADLVILREFEQELAELTANYLEILRNDPVFPTTPQEAKFLDEIPKTPIFAIVKDVETCNVFITDFDAKKIKLSSKIKKTFCAPGDVARNPVRDFLAFLTFDNGKELTLHRDEKNGGDITFKSVDDLNKAIADESVHPADLKDNLKNMIVEILEENVKIFGDEKMEITVKSKKKREGFEKKEVSLKDLFEKNYSALF